MRILTIGDQIFKYKVGKDNVVFRHPKLNTSIIVPVDNVAQLSSGSVVRGRRKETSDGMITPEHIRHYIERVLLWTDD